MLAGLLPIYDGDMNKENIMSHYPVAGSALLLGLVAATTAVLVTTDVLAHLPFFAY